MALFRERHWQRRFFGLAMGCLILLAFEGLCRLADWGKPDPRNDPFVSFAGTSKLFTTDPLTNDYVTASERLKFFVKDRFPRHKEAKTCRIFCLGGSTVQGRPYSIETSFGTWLRLGLETAYPDRKFEIVNCGGVSYASYRLIPILTECLTYEPDHVIVCTGQNEFLEARTYETEKRWHRAHAMASHSRIYHLIQGLKRPAPKATLKQDADALLDYRGGLKAYTRDDAWKNQVQAHYRNNIERLISLSKSAKVPITFLQPPVNLKDCPPFKSDGPALELFHKGHEHLSRADFRRAETAFWHSLEEDLCPLRLLPSMADDLVRICRQAGVPCLDLHALLGKECPQGILGDEILVDHVHPSIRGHQLIANHLITHFSEQFGPTAPDHATTRAKVYQTHLDGLDALYYAHGQQRLRNLTLWTKGQTDGPDYQNEIRTPSTEGQRPRGK